jgi:hypothetical protein
VTVVIAPAIVDFATALISRSKVNTTQEFFYELFLSHISTLFERLTISFNIASLTFVTTSLGSVAVILKQSMMKRSRLAQDSSLVEYTLCEEHFGAPLEPQQSRNGLITPPPEDSQRPSKIRRSGSKLMSVLRSLTNSGMYQYTWSGSTLAIAWNKLTITNEASSPSYEEVSSPMPPSSGVSKKISLRSFASPSHLLSFTAVSLKLALVLFPLIDA